MYSKRWRSDRKCAAADGGSGAHWRLIDAGREPARRHRRQNAGVAGPGNIEVIARGRWARTSAWRPNPAKGQSSVRASQGAPSSSRAMAVQPQLYVPFSSQTPGNRVSRQFGRFPLRTVKPTASPSAAQLHPRPAAKALAARGRDPRHASANALARARPCAAWRIGPPSPTSTTGIAAISAPADLTIRCLGSAIYRQPIIAALNSGRGPAPRPADVRISGRPGSPGDRRTCGAFGFENRNIAYPGRECDASGAGGRSSLFAFATNSLSLKIQTLEDKVGSLRCVDSGPPEPVSS